jgi:ATP-dependent DNA helicase RecG
MQQKPGSAIDIQYVRGIGPRRAEVLRDMGCKSLLDLLEFYPRRYLDRSQITDIADAYRQDDELTLLGTVLDVTVSKGRKTRLVVTVQDESGYIQAVWFRGVSFFAKLFQRGQLLSLSGKPAYYGGWQLIHPDFDIVSDEESGHDLLHTGAIIPIYRSNQAMQRVGLTAHRLRRIFREVFHLYKQHIPECLPDYADHAVPMSYVEALVNIHFPEDDSHLQAAIHTLKFVELFFIQFLIAHRRAVFRQNMAVKVSGDGSASIADFSAGLPFALTPGQAQAMQEVTSDILADQPMHRLLQGDVGSGKTVVALCAANLVLRAGLQVALLAPTEILARQLYVQARKFLDTQVEILFLTASVSGVQRRKVLQHLQQAGGQLIIGTHALLEDKIELPDLGLVIIDEQHRFGVGQRARLIAKGRQPHVLVMTATPIPKTLTMTIFGDLDVSTIADMPLGRKPVRTAIRRVDELSRLWEFVRSQVNQGKQAYFVYPLIEASQKVDLAAAKEGFVEHRKRFADIEVGLLHGQMSSSQREETMTAFARGEIKILITTTVIEVGVDVANASILLVYHAERFGLSQLHQLRGRVGRSQDQAYCILLPGENISEEAAQRLEAMIASNDGFNLAEKDLEIRGTGEFFGDKQSGFDDLRIASLSRDRHLLAKARKTALTIFSHDPQLRHPGRESMRSYFMQRYAGRLNEIQFH